MFQPFNRNCKTPFRVVRDHCRNLGTITAAIPRCTLNGKLNLLGTTALVALASILAQASGIERGSALHRGEKKPMPPQMVDYTKFDDVIVLDCEERPGYIKFQGSQLSPVVRVRVNVRRDTRQNQFASESKYQDLWFNEILPIGSKRFTTNPIKEKHEIGIFLKQGAESMNDAEIAACAAALVRLRLEAHMNRNQLLTVRIPSNIFERLKIQLQRQNFVSYRENSLNITTLIPIPLETEFGKREVMAFLPP